MKVICVNSSPIHYSAYNDSLKNLKEGCIYTVINTYTSINVGFELLEVKSTHPQKGYAAERFIPTSTIDEMELLEQRQDQLQSL